MRRVLKWIAGILLVLLAIPVLAVAALLVLANTSPGRQLIESQTASLTGGMVRLTGLSGRFPDRLRVGKIEVADAKGVYVTVAGVTLDWSPLQLVHKTASVELLQAQSLDVSRLPESSGTSKTSSSSSFNLPVHVMLQRLQIDRATIGAPVAGVAAVLGLAGSAQIDSLDKGTVQLNAKRLDSPGQYDVAGTLGPDRVQARVTAHEPAHGLISEAAHLPDLGGIDVDAKVDGPKDAVATDLSLKAGQLTASANGTVDLLHQGADLTLRAKAPQMTPAAGVSWRSVLVDAHVQGTLAKPLANGTVKIDGLEAAGARVGGLDVVAHGTMAQAALDATVRDLHIPGPQPDLFAADPITLNARAQIDNPDMPVTFALHHTLLRLDGSGQVRGTPSVQAHLLLPDLRPLAKAGGTDVQGHADLNLTGRMQDGTTSATLNGVIGVTGGQAPVPALIGPDAHIDLAADLHGQDVVVNRLAINGKGLTVDAHGHLTQGSPQAVDADFRVALLDLAAVQPSVSGSVTAQGHTAGTLNDLALQTDIAADVAAKGSQPGHIDAHVTAEHLPGAPHAVVNATGTLLDAPLNLALTADKAADGIKANIAELSWKSLQGHGDLRLPTGQTIPVGSLALQVGHLGDFNPLIGQHLQGSADVTLDSTEQAAKLAMALRGVAVPGTASVEKATLDATVDDPMGTPSIDGTLVADGVAASSVKGAAAKVTAKGPLDALALVVSGSAADAAGGSARIGAAGTADINQKSLALSRLEATWKDQTIRTLAPATFNFADGVTIDRLRLGYRQAELALAGHAGSTLDLTATLRNLPADVAAVASPTLAANGVINANAHITGTSSRPEGTVKLTADGVKLRQGPGAALPAANLNADVKLAGTSAHVDTRLVAGRSHLAGTGTVPLAQGGSLNLNTNGQVDLAVLDPILTAQGRRVRGQVVLDAAITGTTSAPQIRGTTTLRNGDVTDYALGAHITDLNALIEATGNTIRLSRLQGRAGPGTLGGSGTVTLTGDMPVDLRFTANNARPLSSELITALINADLYVRGAVKGELQAGGTLFVKQANINIPDSLPPSVAVLPVRDPNAPPPSASESAPSTVIGLDLTLDAPQQVFVRGHGLFAEVGGKIHVAGTSSAPVPSGGLKLRRGTFSLVGATLNFTEGNVTFVGAGISDPAIHFVAQSQTPTMTAYLTVGGTAKKPTITLSSNPDMPQDEILAQLLFQTSTSKLSPLQLAEIASALAQLSGATGGAGNPLETVRNALGLDRLSVGSDSSGNPMVEAGRYVARGVYVGAKQSTSGGGTQATVQIDLYKGLKLETAAGTLANNSTGSQTGTEGASVGLTYQFQY